MLFEFIGFGIDNVEVSEVLHVGREEGLAINGRGQLEGVTLVIEKLFELEGVELEIREDALRAIAKRALARKTGARGLRSILEKALMETMFELPSMDNVSRVTVDANVIESGAQPLFMYEESPRNVSGQSS